MLDLWNGIPAERRALLLQIVRYGLVGLAVTSAQALVYWVLAEQAQGLPVDRRGDLYSLGIMFYEMLVRRKPYHGETAIEILQQHVGAPLPQLPAELAGFQPILDKLLAKRPNDRFDTGAQLIEALAGA